MANLLRSELYKLHKDPAVRLMGLTLIIVAVILSLLLHFFGSRQAAFTGIRALRQSMEMNMVLVKVVLAVLGGFFLTSEYGLGILKVTASSGYSRRQIYLSRLAAYMLGTVTLSLILPLVCTLTGTLLNGFGSLEETGAGEYFLRTMAMTALFTAAFASIVAVLAMRATISGITVGVVLLGMLFFDGVSQLLGSLWSWYKIFYDHTVFKLFLDLPAFQLSAEGLMLQITVSVVTIVLFWLAGAMLFNRMEIK